MTRLDGKRAVITGAASGIGRGIAEYFVDHGASVFLVDINRAMLDQAVDEIGNAARGTTADVGASKDMQRVFAEVDQQMGGLDVLVNNAGITRQGRFLEFAEEDWDEVMRVNLRSVFLGTKYGARLMRDSGHGGAIVNIGSTAAIRAYGGGAGFCPSKAGVVSITQVAAVDLRDYGIRANAVCPGMIETPLFRAHQPERGVDDARIRELQGRIGTPDDIAAIVAFLASDEATLISGQTVTVDAGRTVKLD
jgi:NAD(P)-dependent dehydrogenase (short-subunit alcohol dehydrogenase family)